MNYYKRHLGDYAKNTRTLTTYEHGVYNLVLDLYYTDESPVSSEDAYAVCRAESAKDRASVDRVLMKFFSLDDGAWRHARADEEIQKYLDKAAKNRVIGSMGGKQNAKRIASETLSDSLQERLANDTPSHKPLASNHKEQDQKKGRASAPALPDGVDPQTWKDWLALRKAKRAPVTETVIRDAGREAAKAGLTLTRFLEIWCARGSQGLQADWLKPNERAGPAPASRPSASDDFRGKTYASTPIDQLPPDLREAARAAIAGG